MASAKYPGPPDALDSYASLVEAHPEAQLKGAKNPYTSRNGHMFSFLDADGMLALRVSDDMRERFGESYPIDPVIQYNRVMNGYVSIPPDLLDDLDTLGGWFAESWDWIGTLKPKPTKKKS